MTRILWNFCPWYLGLNQLVTILMDVPLAALRANRKTLRVIERENSRWWNRDTPRLFRIGVRCTCRAIVRARRDLCKDAMPVLSTDNRNVPLVTTLEVSPFGSQGSVRVSVTVP